MQKLPAGRLGAFAYTALNRNFNIGVTLMQVCTAMSILFSGGVLSLSPYGRCKSEFIGEFMPPLPKGGKAKPKALTGGIHNSIPLIYQ